MITETQDPRKGHGKPRPASITLLRGRAPSSLRMTWGSSRRASGAPQRAPGEAAEQNPSLGHLGGGGGRENASLKGKHQESASPFHSPCSQTSARRLTACRSVARSPDS